MNLIGWIGKLPISQGYLLCFAKKERKMHRSQQPSTPATLILVGVSKRLRGQDGAVLRQNCLQCLWLLSSKPTFSLLTFQHEPKKRNSKDYGWPKSNVYDWEQQRFSPKSSHLASQGSKKGFRQLIEIDLANAGTQFGSLNPFCSFDLVCLTSLTI